MRLAQRLRMAGFKPSAPPTGNMYIGFPCNSEGVPDLPGEPFVTYGLAGSKVYATKETASEDGTAVAVNIHATYSSPSSANVYVFLYNGGTLLGTGVLEGNPSDDWTGYIPLVAESGQSLSFSAGDTLRFGVSSPDYEPGYVDKDDGGVEGIMINHYSEEFTDKPPSPIDSWLESDQHSDLGAILEYSAGGGGTTAMVLEVEILAGALGFEIGCYSTPDEYSATIDWGDGTTSEITDDGDADLVHTYLAAGTYTVEITGAFPNITMDVADEESKAKLKKVINLGVVGLTYLTQAFKGCGLTDFIAGETDISQASDLTSFLQDNASLINVNVDGLNTESITTFYGIFRGCSSIQTLDLTSLNAENVESFSNLFSNCGSLTNLDVSGWDTSNVTNMDYMLNNCGDFTVRTGIADFNIGNLTAAGYFMYNSSLLTSEYDELLVNWQGQPHQQNISIDFGNSLFTPGSAAETARQSLIDDDGWTILDGSNLTP